MEEVDVQEWVTQKTHQKKITPKNQTEFRGFLSIFVSVGWETAPRVGREAPDERPLSIQETSLYTEAPANFYFFAVSRNAKTINFLRTNSKINNNTQLFSHKNKKTLKKQFM